MVPSAASLRPFGFAVPRGGAGLRQDLDVAFEGTDRPYLVTALLARCSEDAGAEDWWAQRVGCRIAALLRLAALTGGVDTVAVQLRCPHPPCGSDFEISLPMGALADAPAPDRIDVLLPDGRHAIVRQPTGEDQRRWSEGSYASPREAVTAIVEALVVDGQVSGDDEPALAAIAEALAEHDPLVDFTVSCVCPACEHPGEMAIDLEGLALGRLAAARRSLMRDVHALASAYGWTEGEVLAIPPDRRAQYRALIDGMAR